MQVTWTDKSVARLIVQPISTIPRIQSATGRAAPIIWEVDPATPQCRVRTAEFGDHVPAGTELL